MDPSRGRADCARRSPRGAAEDPGSIPGTSTTSTAAPSTTRWAGLPRLAPAALPALPAELAGLTALRTLTGRHGEPLMDPAFLGADPGCWSADGRRLLEVHLPSPHGFGRG